MVAAVDIVAGATMAAAGAGATTIRIVIGGMASTTLTVTGY